MTTARVLTTVETSRPFPIVLQERARIARRTHVVRGMTRFAVLLLADAFVVVLLRTLYGEARQFAATTSTTLPPLVGGEYPMIELVLAVFLGLWVMGTYGAGDHRRDVGKVFTGGAAGITLVGWNPLWTTPSIAALFGLSAAAAAVAVGLVLERSLIEILVYRARARAAHAPRALLVGPSVDARKALRASPFTIQSEFRVLGYISVDPRSPADALGGVGDFVEVLATLDVDTVIFAGHIEETLFHDLLTIADAAGCHAYSLARPATLTGYVPELVWLRGVPLVQLTRPGLHGQQLVIKRMVDVLVSFFGLILLSPVLAVVGLAVRFTSPGPIIFRQRRVGSGGRPFDILKFRSMVDGADEQRTELAANSVYQDGRLFKVPFDPRVTRVGRFLRRTSLDELPQLWNVLKGEMSLVGPRPPLPSEVALYEEHHYSRFDMKPGITGPWQVNGRNRITDFDEVIRLETAYLRRWAIWKDVAILMRTIPVVLRMDGAH
ncbi:MAG TPA: sugar transferase [Gemmatimonadaceae bacterium]|nr:sugar transferase [Gemmatimonadaceae bacterium]